MTRLAPRWNKCEAYPPMDSWRTFFFYRPSGQGSNWALPSSNALQSDVYNLENGLFQLLTDWTRGKSKTQLIFMPEGSGTRPLTPFAAKQTSWKWTETSPLPRESQRKRLILGHLCTLLGDREQVIELLHLVPFMCKFSRVAVKMKEEYMPKGLTHSRSAMHVLSSS